MANANKSGATRRLWFIIIGLVILLVILGVVGRVTGLLGGGDQALTVEAEEIETRTIIQVVTASGKVQPEVEVKISPDVSGEIIELPVNEGDYVEQGMLLARIKPDFYSAQVEQRQAGVSQARAMMAQRQADVLNAELEFKRQQELYQKGVISESAFQTAQTQFEVAKAAYEAAEYSVESAQAALREAREQLSKTAIFAPMSGTVSKLDVELGERVVGTSQMAGTEMMRIARLDQMELEVDVNENDVVNVSVGDTAAIEIDAYPDRPFRGVVTEIANSARVSALGTQEQVTNFPIKVRILDLHNMEAPRSGEAGGVAASEEVPLPTAGAPQFRPGMSGTVDIFTRSVQGAIAIPIQAVTVRDVNKFRSKSGGANGEAGSDSTAVAAADAAGKPTGDPGEEGPKEDLRKVVFVVQDGVARMVEVETGISDDTHVEVKSGLRGDEQVIIGPYRAISRELEPDTPVQVREGGPGGPPGFASR